MDNMNPLVDALSEDRREEAATGGEAGRPDCRGARQGGQKQSFCGHRDRSGPPPWAGMTSHMGSPCGLSYGPPNGPSWGSPCRSSHGPPCRQSGGPPCGQPVGPPCGPPCEPLYGPQCGPSCGRRCGPPHVQPCGPPFMQCSSGFGPIQCPWGRGPPFKNGPSQYACAWDRGMPPMNDFGPMICPWNRGPSSMHGPPVFGPMGCPWEDEIVDEESNEEHVGKGSDENAGKETHEKSGQERPRCPWGDSMRHRRMRHDPWPMYRRCRRGFGAPSHCPPWSTVPGDCCQPGAPMGWGRCPYPSPFFGPFSCYSAGESNCDPENDNQKQDGDQQTPEEFYPFSQGPLGFGDRQRPRCHGNGRGWQCGPPRNKLYQMLSWKRDVLKEKLQRIESHLERLRSSEEETKEATTGEDAGPEQASSVDTAPEMASPMDTHVRETAERGWEVIADSE